MSAYVIFFKPLIDFFLALMISVLISPLVVLLFFIIVLDSRGNPIFRQIRVGKKGKLFTIFKMRSMVVDAHQRGPYFTSSDDPRVTRVGRFLRRTSLDEIPQLWNVLLGQMSLIGPRPDTPIQKKDYTPKQWRERHLVRPGITGLAQVTRRSLATKDERIALDLKYITQVSFILDIAILVKTVRVIFLRKGVN